MLSKRLRAVDGDGRTAGGEVTLSSHNLVVVLTELEALGRPGIEVGLHIDRTAGALVLTNRPVLLKGRGAINGRLVGTSSLSNLVRRAVRGDSALVLGVGRRVVGTEVLNDVVLDERVAGPAIDGKVRVAVGAVGTRVGDSTGRSRVPSLSSDEVAARAPLDAVGSSVAVGVGGLGATVSPPGEVAAVVGASGGGSALAGNEVARRASSNVSGGGGHGAGGSNGCGDDGSEGNHFEYKVTVEVGRLAC